jgi:formamidopyrimidine-DNA glycosylase
VYHDIRKFGRWQYGATLPARLAELGPEPLDIGFDEFRVRLRRRGAMIKALLLNQEFLRGLGNIYADEALFRAGIHPKTNSARLGPTRAGRLHMAVQEVLRDAIAQGGSTVANYVNIEGTQGYFQLQTFVYGKTGEPCKRCGSPIRRTIVASRSTHFCPKCQRR